MRVVGLDIHHVLAEAVMLENIGMINMEINRRDQAVDGRLIRQLDRHVTFLARELVKIDRDVR